MQGSQNSCGQLHALPPPCLEKCELPALPS